MPKLVDEIRLLLGSDKDIRNLHATPGQLTRALTMLLNEPEEVTRQRACSQLGGIVTQAEPAAIEDFIRRLMWRINPESGDHSLGVPETIGEIGVLAPEQVQPFVPVLLQYADDENLLPGILQAMGRIGGQRPKIAEPHLDIIMLALQSQKPAVYGNACLALLRIDRKRTKLAHLQLDERKVRFFLTADTEQSD